MKLGSWLLALAGAPFLCGTSAHAQISLFATVQGQRIGGITCTNPTGCASSDGKVRPYGGNFGLSYDWREIGPARVGLEARGSINTANKRADNFQGGAGAVRYYTALAGAHASFATPIRILRPYVAVTGGLARGNPVGLAFQNYGLVQGLVGADINLIPSLSFRAIELGAGEMFGPESHGVQSIGIGVVFHLTH